MKTILSIGVISLLCAGCSKHPYSLAITPNGTFRFNTRTGETHVLMGADWYMLEDVTNGDEIPIPGFNQ